MQTTTDVEIKKSRPSLSLFTPDFEPIEYDSGSTQIIAKTEPAFEVEKQYSFDTSSYSEESKQEQAMEMPTLEKKTEIVAKSDEQTERKVYPVLNARAKILISCYSIIVAIMLAFAIYSGVMIASYSADIASKTQIVASQTAVINDLQQTYNRLGDSDIIESSVSDDFSKPTSANTAHVETPKMYERTESRVESNWFEEFCQKFKKLFS